MTDLIGMQIETIEAIVVALATSFVGTSTVAMIVRVALSRLTKKMQEKVLQAERENKISSEHAKKSLDTLLIFEEGIANQINVMQETINKLIQNQNISNETIKILLDEFKERDEKIKELILIEFGDDDE
jgi:Holliday junction resolvasome RuvABC ATP-dependent DNA helicase subunit